MSSLIIPQTLKQARLPLVPRDTCKRSYRDLLSYGFCVTKRMRCAGYSRGGVDACRGDSGGPLVCHRNTKWYLIGVVSWGAECGSVGRYGVYADVLKLKRWIQETIQDAELDRKWFSRQNLLIVETGSTFLVFTCLNTYPVFVWSNMAASPWSFESHRISLKHC